jgi:saccharopine dehydrogenase-like NADP-dependent oxidoreductase
LRHHGNAGYRAVLNCLVELECSADSKEKLQGFSASWLEFQAALRLQELNTARSTLLVGCFARDFSNGY